MSVCFYLFVWLVGRLLGWSLVRSFVRLLFASFFFWLCMFICLFFFLSIFLSFFPSFFLSFFLFFSFFLFSILLMNSVRNHLYCGRAAVPTKLHALKVQNTPRLSTDTTVGYIYHAQYKRY